MVRQVASALTHCLPLPALPFDVAHGPEIVEGRVREDMPLGSVPGNVPSGEGSPLPQRGGGGRGGGRLTASHRLHSAWTDLKSQRGTQW